MRIAGNSNSEYQFKRYTEIGPFQRIVLYMQVNRPERVFILPFVNMRNSSAFSFLLFASKFILHSDLYSKRLPNTRFALRANVESFFYTRDHLSLAKLQEYDQFITSHLFMPSYRRNLWGDIILCFFFAEKMLIH